jgi:peptide deformylase
MPIKPIITDKAALSKPCKETTLEEARPVIQDLMDTVHSIGKKKCAGLAANQIGSDLRVFVVKIRGKYVAFINPSWMGAVKKVAKAEGCLSFPGKQVSVLRWTTIFTTPPINKKRGYTLSNTEARAFQHELDHLNGITI